MKIENHMGFKTNQGREIKPVLDAITHTDLERLAEVGWIEVDNHPTGANCGCVVIEILAKLHELGYRIEKDEA